MTMQMTTQEMEPLWLKAGEELEIALEANKENTFNSQFTLSANEGDDWVAALDEIAATGKLFSIPDPDNLPKDVQMIRDMTMGG